MAIRAEARKGPRSTIAATRPLSGSQPASRPGLKLNSRATSANSAAAPISTHSA